MSATTCSLRCHPACARLIIGQGRAARDCRHAPISDEICGSNRRARRRFSSKLTACAMKHIVLMRYATHAASIWTFTSAPHYSCTVLGPRRLLVSERWSHQGHVHSAALIDTWALAVPSCCSYIADMLRASLIGQACEITIETSATRAWKRRA